MRNVLVTGSNGQLASCIKDLAKEQKGLHFIYTDYQELDICNLKQVDKFFKTNQKIDYCINCAAYTAVDKAESDAEKAFEINANGAKNLALVCDEQGAVLIHISTDFVFDGDKTEPYIETDTPKPISVYGASKLKGEVENFAGVIGGKADGKCTLSLIASDNIVSEKEINAGAIIREVSIHIQGGGGGQPNFATAGGKNASGLEKAITEVKAKF